MNGNEDDPLLRSPLFPENDWKGFDYMGKSTPKSYDEKMRDLQRKMAELKKDRKEKDRKHTYAIGTYIVRMIPGLLDKFEEDEFELEAYLSERLVIKELSETSSIADASSDEEPIEESVQNVSEGTEDVGAIPEVSMEKKTAEISEAKAPATSSTGSSPAKTASVNNHVRHVMMEQSENSAVGQSFGNSIQGT